MAWKLPGINTGHAHSYCSDTVNVCKIPFRPLTAAGASGIHLYCGPIKEGHKQRTRGSFYLGHFLLTSYSYRMYIFLIILLASTQSLGHAYLQEKLANGIFYSCVILFTKILVLLLRRWISSFTFWDRSMRLVCLIPNI